MMAIRPGLIRWAKRIGTWLIRRFAEWVADKVIVWLELKADDWKRRHKRPRLRRLFAAAAKWLRAHLPQIGKCAAGEFHALADKLHAQGVPVAVECEELAA